MHELELATIFREEVIRSQEIFRRFDRSVPVRQLRSIIAEVFLHAIVESEVTGVQVVLERSRDIILGSKVDGIFVGLVKRPRCW